jgi:hypothetical protein
MHGSAASVFHRFNFTGEQFWAIPAGLLNGYFIIVPQFPTLRQDIK